MSARGKPGTGRPIGSVVELEVDLMDRVAPDDVIETRLRRRYRVLSVRDMRNGHKKLHARVEDSSHALPKNTVVHRVRWYGPTLAVLVSSRRAS